MPPRAPKPAHVCEVHPTPRKNVQECVCMTCHLTLGFSPRVELLEFLRQMHQGQSEQKQERAR